MAAGALPGCIDNEHVGYVAHLQSAVSIASTERSRCIERSRNQSFFKCHVKVDAGQVHDERLKQTFRRPKTPHDGQAYHREAVRVGIEVRPQCDGYSSIDHLSDWWRLQSQDVRSGW